MKGLFSNCIPDKKLCPKIITSPIIPITPAGSLSRNERIINPNPIAAITSKSNILKCRSNQIAKLITVNSIIISQIPLVINNRLVDSRSFLFFIDMKADVPARNTKTGAQKWVIQRVKKSNGEVVTRFRGS
jgi:hypothetical protein